MKSSLIRSGTGQGSLVLPLLFNIVLEVLAKAIRQENINKRIQVGKEEVSVFLFTNDVMLHIENPKEYTRKLQEVISNKFNKVAVAPLFCHSLAFQYHH